MSNLNPRYVHYARVPGHDPEAQRAHDEEAWPGGRMCGFQLWSKRRMREFCKANPSLTIGTYPYESLRYDGDFDVYDAWLADLPVGYDIEPTSRAT